MPAPKKAKLSVTIAHKKGECHIHPSVVVVPAGRTVTFKKSIPGTVYVQVSRIGRPFKFKKNTRVLKIPRSTRMGIYPYAVFCYDRKDFCTGSSMPIIIVPTPDRAR